MPTNKNVVLMIADDLGLHLGCYGTSVATPNIDQLANQGSRFTHAYASTASCSGSRSTIYTGLHTHQNGQRGLSHGIHSFQTHAHIETAPQVFNALGYQTGIIGKVHVGPREAYPWDIHEESGTRDVTWVAERTGAFLDKAQESGRPFHLTVGFRDPHRDNTRGGFGNEDSGILDKIPVPDYQPEDVDVPVFLTDVPEVRKELVQYYKAISRMDAGVGMVLSALKERGLDDSTMVIVLSDNGAPFVNSKTTLYDSGVRLPFIVRCPGTTNTGVLNPNLVSFIDILPTCIAWAGCDDSMIKTSNTGKSPPRLGRSFLSILGSASIVPAESWQSHVFGSHTFHEIQNYWPTRFLRTHRFKYHRNLAHRLDFPFGTDLYVSLSWEGIRNSSNDQVMIGRRTLQQYIFRGPEELFDLENDPEEVNNLAEKQEFQEILRGFRAQLEEWQWKTGDPWLIKDGVSMVTSARFQRDLGLKVPDRLDFDVKAPGNKEGPHWPTPEQGPGGSALLFAG